MEMPSRHEKLEETYSGTMVSDAVKSIKSIQ
jgi:hypothetical protein